MRWNNREATIGMATGAEVEAADQPGIFFNPPRSGLRKICAAPFWLDGVFS